MLKRGFFLLLLWTSTYSLAYSQKFPRPSDDLIEALNEATYAMQELDETLDEGVLEMQELTDFFEENYPAFYKDFNRLASLPEVLAQTNKEVAKIRGDFVFATILLASVIFCSSILCMAPKIIKSFQIKPCPIKKSKPNDLSQKFLEPCQAV